MKLLVAIVQDADVAGLVKELNRRHLEVTKLSSTGGFLREGNTTLLIGVDEDRLDLAREVIRERCRSRTRFVTPGIPVAEQPEPFLAQPVEVPVGGAVVFVMNVDEFFKV
ncbi:MAG TPA: cyclic-di-AMP receptor [Deinococcales bacterium]|nr:cyclic-di-AMP receptor [Deinococcales bacterium]